MDVLVATLGLRQSLEAVEAEEAVLGVLTLQHLLRAAFDQCHCATRRNTELEDVALDAVELEERESPLEVRQLFRTYIGRQAFVDESAAERRRDPVHERRFADRSQQVH